jgi:ribulose kinase
VRAPADVETTALGAAVLAAVGAGLFDGASEAAAAMTRLSEDVSTPQAEAAERLEEGYRRYRLLFEALAPAFAGLA